jgi:twitching motility protein PilT
MAFKDIFGSFMKGKKVKELPEKQEKEISQETFPTKKLIKSESNINRNHYKSVEDTLKILWSGGDIHSSFLGQIFYSRGQREHAIALLSIIENIFFIHVSVFLEASRDEAEKEAKDSTLMSKLSSLARSGSARAQTKGDLVSKEEKRAALGIILEPLQIIPCRIIKTSLSSDYTLKDLFQIMLREGASDLHISIGLSPKFRIKGELAEGDLPPVTEEKSWELISKILSDKQREIFEREWDLDFTYEVSELARFRSNILKEQTGIGGVFRIIPPEIPSMEELGLPQILKKIAAYKQGLIIVTGPTGSGKTTTMACLLDYINSTRSANILTIEDPLEFIHKNKKSQIKHREVGIHTPIFSDAVKAARREDLDVIMIGEMRDLDTMTEAIQAADMGNLVLGIMHTTGVTRTIERIIEGFPGQMQGQIRSMLSSCLRAVIAQQLILTMDGTGRCAAVEVALSTQSLGNMIRDGKTKMINAVIHSSRDIGMQSLDLALLHLVKNRKIDEETARLRSSSPRSFTVPEEFKPVSSE